MGDNLEPTPNNMISQSLSSACIIKSRIKECFGLREAFLKGHWLLDPLPWAGAPCCATSLPSQGFWTSAIHCHCTVTLSVHTAHQFTLLPAGEYKIQHSTSPCWFFCHLEKEVIIKTGGPGLLMLCCVVLQQILGWLKSPMSTRACECEAASVCL